MSNEFTLLLPREIVLAVQNGLIDDFQDLEVYQLSC